jgi:hypothetical protein
MPLPSISRFVDFMWNPLAGIRQARSSFLQRVRNFRAVRAAARPLPRVVTADTQDDPDGGVRVFRTSFIAVRDAQRTRGEQAGHPMFLARYLESPDRYTAPGQQAPNPVRVKGVQASGQRTRYRVTIFFEDDCLPSMTHIFDVGSMKEWRTGLGLYISTSVDAPDGPWSAKVNGRFVDGWMADEGGYVFAQLWVDLTIVVEDITPVQGAVAYLPFREGLEACFIVPFYNIHDKMRSFATKDLTKEGGRKTWDWRKLAESLGLSNSQRDSWNEVIKNTEEAMAALSKIELRIRADGVSHHDRDLIREVGYAARVVQIKIFTPDNFHTPKITYDIDHSKRNKKDRRLLIPEVKLMATRAGHVDMMQTYQVATVDCALTHSIGILDEELPHADFMAKLSELAHDEDVVNNSKLVIKVNQTHQPQWFWHGGVRYTQTTKGTAFMKDAMKQVGHAPATEAMYGPHLVASLAEGCLIAGIAIFPKLRELVDDSIGGFSFDVYRSIVVLNPLRFTEITGVEARIGQQFEVPYLHSPTMPVDALRQLNDEPGVVYHLSGSLSYKIPAGYAIKDVDMRKAYLNWSANLPPRYITRKNGVPGLFAESFAPTPAEVDEMLDVSKSSCEGFALMGKIDFSTARYTSELVADIEANFETPPADLRAHMASLSDVDLRALLSISYSIDGYPGHGGEKPRVLSFVDLRFLKACDVAFEVEFVWLSYDIVDFDMGTFAHATEDTEDLCRPCYVVGPGMLMAMSAHDIYLVPGDEEDAEQLCALANQTTDSFDKESTEAQRRHFATLSPEELAHIEATQDQKAQLTRRQVLVSTIGGDHVEFRTPKAGGIRSFAQVSAYITRGVGIQLLLSMAATPFDQLLRSQLDGFHRLWPVDVDESTMPMMKGMRIKKTDDGHDRAPTITSLSVAPLARLAAHSEGGLPDVGSVERHPRAPFLHGFRGGSAMLLGPAGSGKSYAVSDALLKKQLFGVLVTVPSHDLSNEHTSPPKLFPAGITHAMLSDAQGEMAGGPPRHEIHVQYGADKNRCSLRSPYANIFVDECNFLSQHNKGVILERFPHSRFLFACDMHPVTLAPRQLQGGRFGGAMNDSGVTSVHYFDKVRRTDQPELLELWASMYEMQDECAPIHEAMRSVFEFLITNGMIDHIISNSMALAAYDPSRDHIVAPTRNCHVCGQACAENCTCTEGATRDEINFADEEHVRAFDEKHTDGILPYSPYLSQVHEWEVRVRDKAPPLKVTNLRKAAKIISGFDDDEADGEAGIKAAVLVKGGRYVPRCQGEANALIEAKACTSAAGTSVHAKQGMTIERGERLLMVFDKTWDISQTLVQVTRVREKESLYVVLDDKVHKGLAAYASDVLSELDLDKANDRIIGYLECAIKLHRCAGESEMHRKAKHTVALHLAGRMPPGCIVREEYTLSGEIMPSSIAAAQKHTDAKKALAVAAGKDPELVTPHKPHPVYKTADVAVVRVDPRTGEHTAVEYVIEIVVSNKPDEDKIAYYKQKKIKWMVVQVAKNSDGDITTKGIICRRHFAPPRE